MECGLCEQDVIDETGEDDSKGAVCMNCFEASGDALREMILRQKESLRKLRARFAASIVCLCGSTRFWDTFHEVGWQMTLDGFIVLSVGVCKHTDSEGGHGAEVLGPDVVERLDELHKRKIELCDRVMVLNVGGYVGDSTRSEVLYAREHGKPIHWLEPDAIPIDLQEKVSEH